MKSTKFKHVGFDCEVYLTVAGHYCGYVGLPEGHQWFGVYYDNIPAEVHGGLTYSEPGKDGLWWVGFDCAHSGDGMKEGLPGWKDEAYATAETKKLAEQCGRLRIGASSMTIVDLDSKTSDEALDKLSDEDRREYHKTFVEIAYLSLLVNLYTDYCVFFHYSGHVWSCRVDIRRSKTRYNEEVAATEFKCLTNPDDALFDWGGIDWLKRKRDMLREILETKNVPIEDMTREVIETYAYSF